MLYRDIHLKQSGSIATRLNHVNRTIHHCTIQSLGYKGLDAEKETKAVPLFNIRNNIVFYRSLVYLYNGITVSVILKIICISIELCF